MSYPSNVLNSSSVCMDQLGRGLHRPRESKKKEQHISNGHNKTGDCAWISPHTLLLLLLLLAGSADLLPRKHRVHGHTHVEREARGRGVGHGLRTQHSLHTHTHTHARARTARTKSSSTNRIIHSARLQASRIKDQKRNEISSSSEASVRNFRERTSE
jgi:hypothetical protein